MLQGLRRQEKPATPLFGSPLNKAVVTAFAAILLAFCLKNAPGEPEWSYDPTPIEEDGFVRFVGSGATMLSGKLFLPPNDSHKAPPVIILAHGLGLSQDSSLEPFVDAFTAAGFAAFTFDYATFGASDGFVGACGDYHKVTVLAVGDKGF